VRIKTDRSTLVFVGLAVAGVVGTVAFWGFIAWAIFRLVMHFTGG
jgi:hypothetical protein